jgi:flavin reductase (DIM6/NTAB) family NADH-FMN oxidoreductase RutF
MEETDWTYITPQSFKAFMAHWASGVTVVTTHQARSPIGMTVSSFAGVSLQPPQVLICVNHSAQAHAMIGESRCFAVNLLGVKHLEWGMRFAGLRPTIADRFQGIEWFTAQTGAPILPDVLGWLDCRLLHAIAEGDHTVFVGDVIGCDVCESGLPLLYSGRAWRQLADQALL